MTVEALDHVNLRTTRLAEMIRWYTEILDMAQGFRPGFPFPGAWLYAGDHALVHLVGITDDEGIGSDASLKLEHFALRAHDLDGFLARLEQTATRFERSELQDVGITQINVWDPDGNHIHVDFKTPEKS